MQHCFLSISSDSSLISLILSISAALQHVYRMAVYRNFVEVNVEDPGPAMKILRDSTLSSNL